MAFPATYNINYYMGDTHEFRIYPKDSSGAVFPLAQYTSVKFTIAERRGTPLPDDQAPIEAYAEFSTDRTNILCAIRGVDAISLDPTKQYVFDVQISKVDAPYDSVLTLLTGNITITDQVTVLTAADNAGAPGVVTNLGTTEVTDTTVGLGWSAPTNGGSPTEYKVYLIPYDPIYDNPTGLAQLLAALPLAVAQTTTQTSVVLSVTTSVPALSIESDLLTPSTSYIYAVIASNDEGDSDPVGNFDIVNGAIDEINTTGDNP